MRRVEKQLICLALSADKSSPRITYILNNRFPINYLGRLTIVERCEVPYDTLPSASVEPKLQFKWKKSGLAVITICATYFSNTIFEIEYICNIICSSSNCDVKVPSKKKFSCNEKFSKLFKKRVFAESLLRQQMLTGFVVLP